MIKAFASPSSYVQGKGVLFESKPYLESFGTKPLLITGGHVYEAVGKDFEAYLTKQGFDVILVNFNGESSTKEIDRIAAIAKDQGATAIYGLGGGKTSDTAKAVADTAKLPVVIMPTLASTDAPCSRLSVIYKEDGTVENYRFYDHNPELVLVDSQVIANAPARLLVAGIADALATNVEAQAVTQSGADTMLDAKQTLVGIAIAEKCEETLFKYAHQAVAAVEQNVVSSALEKIIEANALMSGLGFESGGLSGAHAIHNGFTVLEECHHMYHGEKVAFGTLTQLVLENVPLDELEDIILWCIEVGLPVTLAELGAGNITDDQLMEVAKTACAETDTLHNMPFEVTPETVFAAIKAADAYGRYYLDEEE